MDKRLLDILCCPVSKSPLRMLGAAELDALNRAVAADRLLNAAGTRIAAPLAAGLVTRDAGTVYRLDDGIPVMLADEAIATAQVEDFPRT